MSLELTARLTPTDYFVDYSFENGYTLVRKRDLAFLYQSFELNEIFAICFRIGINKENLVIW